MLKDVVVRAPTFAVPWTSKLNPGFVVPTPILPLTVKLLDISTFPLTVTSPLTAKLLVTSKFSPTETFETDVSVVVCMSAPGKFMMCVDII
jgi:hypothetical protein